MKKLLLAAAVPALMACTPVADEPLPTSDYEFLFVGEPPVAAIREFELEDGTRCVISSNRYTRGRASGTSFGGGIDCDWNSSE